MDDSDLDSNYLSESEQSSYGSSSQHSARSLEMRRNQMNLDDGDDDDDDDDDDDTNQQEPDDETNEHQSYKTSDVWEHIDKITDPEKPKCKICSKVFSAKSSTSTLRNHIKKNHKHIHKEANQTTLKFTSFYDKRTNYEFVKLLIKWIVIDMLPFSLVESVYFNEFIRKLNPKFQCPGRSTLKKEILSEFNSRREHIVNFVKNISGRCSLTTDIWSSIKNEAFIGVTIHYITDEWELKHFTLEVLRITGSHTGNAIYEILNKLLEDFNLKEKVLSITTDNGSNMVLACRLLKSDFETADFIHSRCICHILNLAVNAGLKNEENLIKKLRKIVKTIRRTQLYLEELERLAIADNKTFKRPTLDVKTRWNSTFLMIKCALDLKEDLSILNSRNKPLQDIWLDEDEWEKIEHLVDLLSQFNIATIELSTQTYPTIAHARVVLLGLLVDLNSKNQSQNYPLTEVLLPIRNKIWEYWNYINEMTHVATFFDPRYKTIAFQDLETNEILEPIRNKLPVTSSLPSNNRTSIFVQRLSSVRQQRNANTDELIRYWELADASFDMEPLSWWRAHSTEYPILSKMAQDYLSVQASSVPCEQLFSLAGNVVSKKRNRLNDETTRACLCLRSWMFEEI